MVAIIESRILLAGILQFAIMMFGMGMLHGLAPILYSESFPTRFRYSGAGLSFNLAGVLGGMSAPSLLATLIGSDVLRNWYYVPVMYAAYGAIAPFALQFVRETRGLGLEDLDAPLEPRPDA
jgi:MFS transporter, MHS family, shikimate and dehydroshikimate transport protein